MTYLISLVKTLCITLSNTKLLPVKKGLFFPLVLLLLTTISGCKSSSKEEVTIAAIGETPSELASLQSARIKWDNNSGQYYTIQSQRICECLPEISSQMKVSILDNSVLSAVDINSDELISKKIQDEITTVDDLFDLLEKAIDDNVSIDVTYNEEYGYPETTKINVEQLAVDGGLYITLSKLELQDSLTALDDVIWTLQSFDNIAGPQDIIKNTNITLSFDLENNQLSGVGSCNNYSADFVLDNVTHDITISNIMSDERWCDIPENIMQQEQYYFATLAEIRFFTFDKATLNMTVGADAGLHFIAYQNSDDEPEVDNTSNDLLALENARKKWHDNSGQYYTIQSQRICFCLPEMSALMTISVLENSVLSAIGSNSGAIVSKEIREEITTVDDLFNLLEQAITDDLSIEVTYNADYGYPETAKIDIEQLAVDGGLHITLSKLELQDSQSALDDVTWTLESFDSIAGPQPIIKNTNVTLSIDLENGQLTGIGSCNNYSADFVLNDKNHDITISNIISTEMWCDQPENLMQQEQTYFATLAQIRFFTFDQVTLNMVVGGDAGLHFVAVD